MSKSNARSKATLETQIKVTRANGDVEYHTTKRKVGFLERLRLKRILKDGH